MPLGVTCSTQHNPGPIRRLQRYSSVNPLIPCSLPECSLSFQSRIEGNSRHEPALAPTGHLLGDEAYMATWNEPTVSVVTLLRITTTLANTGRNCDECLMYADTQSSTLRFLKQDPLTVIDSQYIFFLWYRMQTVICIQERKMLLVINVSYLHASCASMRDACLWEEYCHPHSHYYMLTLFYWTISHDGYRITELEYSTNAIFTWRNLETLNTVALRARLISWWIN